MLCQDQKHLEEEVEVAQKANLKNHEIRPQIPTILTEVKVAVTPMGADLRIGGTLEISQLDPRINTSRLAGIVEAIPKYFNDCCCQGECG